MGVHKHKTRKTKTTGFQHCVSKNCNPASHGNIMLIEYCECGAIRKTNINQKFEECSGWQPEAAE